MARTYPVYTVTQYPELHQAVKAYSERADVPWNRAVSQMVVATLIASGDLRADYELPRHGGPREMPKKEKTRH